MILRDPVHGLIAFEGSAGSIVEKLLDAREVQRLRRVRQLGLTSFVFPGAEHSRFSHALGAAHLMLRLQQRIVAQEHSLPVEHRMTDVDARDAVAAAFLHDLGHGPFSHLFEEVTPASRHHEEWTSDIILDPSTDVHRILSAHDAEMPSRVVALLHGDHRLGYLSRSISGTLDVDRGDYLLRDSHMTGVRYGVYDLDWLLRSLSFGYVGSANAGEWVLAIEGRKGLPPVEGFFLARHFMYGQVYHHKATRAAETLVRGIFVRVSELIRDGRVPAQAPEALVRAASGLSVALGSYLELDDSILQSCFAAWQHDQDPALARLCQAWVRRALPKTVPLPEDSARRADWQEAMSRASEIAEKAGFRPDLHIFLDAPEDVPYAEPSDDSPEGMWVALRHQPIQRLGRVSFLLGQLCNARVTRPRLIFPAAIREDVLRAVEEVIA